jgi:lipoyl(octanoyl) transferase
MRQKVIFQDLGLTDYFDTWQYQTEIHQKLKEEKKIINNPNPSHTLIFCEHHAVFTLGRSGSQENLIVSPEYLAENNIQFYKINRGGDITYHGPGQIVGYPIFDLDLFFNDVHKYVRLLEESVIQTLKHYNIIGYREAGYTGVWINRGNEKRKISWIKRKIENIFRNSKNYFRNLKILTRKYRKRIHLDWIFWKIFVPNVEQYEKRRF